MTSERRMRTLYVVALLAILLAATFLRFYRLDASSLWSDEGNTWAMLSRSYGEIAQAAAADIHPPGYYWLLKLWSSVFGTSAAAMRSFSAVAGVLLVLVIERIGRLLVADRFTRRWLPLLAALVAAVNPLLVYYSQEARMYMLLALAAAGLFWTMLAGEIWGLREVGTSRRPPLPGGPAVGYVLFAALGLWTHYSFAMVLAAANLAWLVRWSVLHFQRTVARPVPASWRGLAAWIGINLVALLVYSPWLPSAVTSVTGWPKGGVAAGWWDGMEHTLRTLLFGPLRQAPQPLWPWLLAGALLPLLGAAGLFVAHSRTSPSRWWASSVVLPLLLWLGMPIGLMAGLGLFTDAFLKFLITAAPAWCLLLACVPLVARQPVVRGLLAAGVALVAIAMAVLVLPGYYRDAYARDNYQGIATYIAGVGHPQRDLVILDAPGQQEVWRYYDPGLPVLPVPAGRPPSAAEVESALASGTAGRRNLYALFWATDEADPERLVESWLDQNAFKALDIWQGNVRLATYALAGDLQPLPMDPIQLGDAISLSGQAQPASPQRVAPGDAALVQLRWDVLQDVSRRHKMSVQLLNAANQVVAQRDGEPVGGSRPTDTWRAGEQILDNYALPVPLGTPPGDYRLVAAMYDAQTGQRLTHAAGDSVELGNVWVGHPQIPPSPSLIPMAQRLERSLGPVTLLGYDAYRKDFAHAPQTPLRPGDTARVVLYWQAPAPLPLNWPADLAVTLRLGNQVLTAPLAGVEYPTGEWQGGEIVRGQFDIPYEGTGSRLQVEVAGQPIWLEALPVE
jgi:mannosyltransferase